MLQYIPAPNNANGFATSAYNQTLEDDKAGGRVDANTRWGLLSAYYFFDNFNLDNPYPTAQSGASVPGFNALTTGRAQLLALSLTKVINASTVNDAHISYLRDITNLGQPVGGSNVSLVSQGFENCEWHAEHCGPRSQGAECGESQLQRLFHRRRGQPVDSDQRHLSSNGYFLKSAGRAHRQVWRLKFTPTR